MYIYTASYVASCVNTDQKTIIMPRGIDVWPKKWQERTILFDDGEYSICWGTFEGDKGRMGQRWNENYPRQGSSPTWYIMYDKLIYSTLVGLEELIKVSKNISKEEKIVYEEARKKALEEYQKNEKARAKAKNTTWSEEDHNDLPF